MGSGLVNGSSCLTQRFALVPVLGRIASLTLFGWTEPDLPGGSNSALLEASFVADSNGPPPRWVGRWLGCPSQRIHLRERFGVALRIGPISVWRGSGSRIEPIKWAMLVVAMVAGGNNWSKEGTPSIRRGRRMQAALPTVLVYPSLPISIDAPTNLRGGGCL